MATDFNPNQKLSMVIKHQNDINYTSDEKYWFSETISGGHIQLSRELWIDDDKIIWNDPEQSIANGVIEQVSITLTEDVTVADQMCWIADDNGTQLDNWVHPLHFGTKYAITLQRHNGVKIPTDSSWIFNYKSGVLTFAVPPSSINLTMPFKIIGYRYIGDFFRASTPTSFIGLQDVFASGVQSGQIVAAISSSGFSNTHLTVPYIEEHINYQDIHLTPEEIDHSRLMNTSGYTHTEINDHINDLGAHFYPPAINHDELMNASGHLSHTNIDNYINAVSGHMSFIPHILQSDYLHDGSRGSTSGWLVNEYTSGIIALEDSAVARSGKALVVTNPYDIANPAATWTYKHPFTTGDRTVYNIRFKYKVTINDDLAPIITAGPTISNIGSSTAVVNFTINENTTVYALVLPTADPVPSSSTIISSGVSKNNISANVANTINLTGMSAVTAYKVHIVAKDANDNISEVASSSEFVTTEVVPILTSGPTVLEDYPNSRVYYTVDTNCDVYVYLVEVVPEV